jgi:hypothetical protein
LNVRPVPSSLVLAELTEHPPPAIGDGLGKRAVLEHPIDVQGFQPDHAILGDKPMAEFVQEVGSLASDMLMLTSHKEPCLLAVVAAFLLAR